ncbi:hypothetical protein H1Q59_06800 [Holosporaceae bacterium 'Namur']|nr:hypothetical protein [Holosporaceae bacterium 'Namur']
MKEEIRQTSLSEVEKILGVEDRILQKNIVTDILRNNGLLWQNDIDDRMLLARQVRQLKFLYGLVIYNSELSDRGASEFIDLAWESTIGVDERLLSRNVQGIVRQEIKSKLLDEARPTILEIAKSLFIYETSQQKVLRTEIARRMDSFIRRVRNDDINLLKIKDPQILNEEEFLDPEGLYQVLRSNTVAYATGNNYRRLGEGGKYKKPEGKQEVYDVARVDLTTVGGKKVIISSIADGHMHAMDEQQDRQIKEIANLGCKLGNRELERVIGGYWREVEINKEEAIWKEGEKPLERNYSFSPKLFRLAISGLEVLLEYQTTSLHNIVKDVLIRMSNYWPRNNFEHSGLTIYAACIEEYGLRMSGFSIGDQMVIGYSPSQGFINIVPSIRLTGGPDFWNHEKDEIEADEVPFLTFDQALPIDTTIISYTDGVFDMLPEGCVLQEELGSYESFGKKIPSVYRESINTEEMNRLCKQGLRNAEEVKSWLLDIVKESIRNKEDSEVEDKAIEIGDDTTIVAVNIEKVIMKTGLLQRGICKDSAYI